jgi:phage tail-like protein
MLPGGIDGGGSARNAAVSAARMALKKLGLRFDPGLTFRYYVEVEGIIDTEFSECSGLSMEREVKIVAEGGVNDFVHVLPGRVKYSNIILRNGITYSRELWRWFRQGIYSGKVERLNMSIILGNAEGKKVKHWDVIGAYPVKWSGPELRADSEIAAIETVELAHHGLDLSLEVMTPMRFF